jgi:HlyD family secretion protein
MLAVAWREAGWIRRDATARFLLLGLPAMAFVLLGLGFGSASLRGHGIVVVDLDHSEMSRRFIQTLAAAPGITLAGRADDPGTAARAIRAGDAAAAVTLPAGFGRDVLAGRRPHPVAISRTPFVTAGKSLQDTMAAAAAAIAPAPPPQPGTAPALGDVPVSEPVHATRFLLATALTAGLLMALSAACAVGSEFRRRDLQAWWTLSGHSVAAALAGKLLPYAMVLLAMTGLAAVIGDAALGTGFLPAAPVTGMVRATELRIAPEISGRLTRVLVQPGQSVRPGEPLALLSNPGIPAAAAQARARLGRATADRTRVYAGSRPDEIETLRREIIKAQAALLLARQDLDRKSSLVARLVASRQQLDGARAEAARAEADLAVVQAGYAEAGLGASGEDRALADARLAAAEAAVDVVEARAAKLLLRAPAAGVIGIVVREAGETVRPGEPVLTLLPQDGRWFGFTVREDALAGMSPGAQVVIGLPDAGGRAQGTVAELHPMADFATWPPAPATGGHALNTFFVRVDPLRPEALPAAGQTVWLVPDRPGAGLLRFLEWAPSAVGAWWAQGEALPAPGRDADQSAAPH